jgi:CDP-paratose 2-epimerase
MKPVLVTGGAGFIGCNLADRLVREGHEVIVYDSLARPGVERNVEWLRETHGDKVSAITGDVRDMAELTRAVREASAVFHMAAQVAVTTSLDDPRSDFETNVLGAVNLLEAARGNAEPTPVIFASTNKVYGDLADLDLSPTPEGYLPVDKGPRDHGVGETQPLDFHTPYGCSKGAADQYVLDYARSYNLPTAVMRMSCIYGRRQRGTEDQGWVAHFLIRALSGQPITLYGDGQQVRDILDVRDAVAAYLAVWRKIERVSGRAFNLGGGPDNAVSLRTVLAEIERLVGEPLDISSSDWRQGDQRYFVADTRTLEATLGWQRTVRWRDGVARLTEELRDVLPARARAAA